MFLFKKFQRRLPSRFLLHGKSSCFFFVLFFSLACRLNVTYSAGGFDFTMLYSPCSSPPAKTQGTCGRTEGEAVSTSLAVFLTKRHTVCRGVFLATAIECSTGGSTCNIRIGHRYIEYVTPSFVARSPVVRRNRLRLTTGEHATQLGVTYSIYRCPILMLMKLLTVILDIFLVSLYISYKFTILAFHSKL